MVQSFAADFAGLVAGTPAGEGFPECIRLGVYQIGCAGLFKSRLSIVGQAHCIHRSETHVALFSRVGVAGARDVCISLS